MSGVMEDDPMTWVELYGDGLFAYAKFRVGKREVAQDLVQETLLAGLKGREKFSGKSTVKTWLHAILRNKVADHFRKSGRELTETDLAVPGSEDEGMFGVDGWVKPECRIPSWGIDSDDPAEKGEFWEIFRACVSKLPERTAEVFLAREVDGTSTEELCEVHGVSASNFWVMMHRARGAMRKCLEKNWFVDGVA